MKKNIYFITTLSFLLFAAIGISSCTETPTEYTFITEEEVRRIMAEVETSSRNRDIDTVIEHMAPSIRINVTVESPFGSQKQRFTRRQYKTETAKGWAMASDYKYERKNEVISISEDGQSAIVEATIAESMIVQGRRIRSTTYEKAKIEVLGEQFLVTELDAHIKM